MVLSRTIAYYVWQIEGRLRRVRCRDCEFYKNGLCELWKQPVADFNMCVYFKKKGGRNDKK